MGAGMGAASVGMSAIQAGQQMKAASAKGNAAIQKSGLEWQEFHRQKGEVTDQARADKSTRAREADKAMGRMLAVMADNGGAGTNNESRFAGEIGYLSGLDITRLEGNRMKEVQALSSAQTASGWRALNIISDAGAQAQGAIWNVAKAGVSQYKNSLGGSATEPGTGFGGGGGTGSGANAHMGQFATGSNGQLVGGI